MYENYYGQDWTEENFYEDRSFIYKTKENHTIDL